MPRFETLEEAFFKIRNTPTEFLPRVSLRLLSSFWDGYCSYNGGGDRNLLLPPGFNEFIDARYKNRASLNAISVIELYTSSDAEAWNLYFALLDEFRFRRFYAPAQPTPAFRSDSVVNFEELLLAMLARPAMYFGSRRFDLLVAFINGWFQRAADFERDLTPYERRFVLLQQYIEKDINLPGPKWHSIIWFWSQSDERAFEMFAAYVNEFLTQGKGWIKQIEASMQRRSAGDL